MLDPDLLSLGPGPNDFTGGRDAPRDPAYGLHDGAALALSVAQSEVGRGGEGDGEWRM